MIYWATKNYIQHNSEKSDPAEVVIDEVIGQWIAILPIWHFKLKVFHCLKNLASKDAMACLYLGLCYLFSFRFFDIIKLGLEMAVGQIIWSGAGGYKTRRNGVLFG